MKVWSNGTIQSDAAEVSSANASVSSVVLATSDPDHPRSGLIVVNDSASATMYLCFGATASPTQYTRKLAAGETYEMPADRIYAGPVSAVWSAAVGAARVTELL